MIMCLRPKEGWIDRWCATASSISLQHFRALELTAAANHTADRRELFYSLHSPTSLGKQKSARGVTRNKEVTH